MISRTVALVAVAALSAFTPLDGPLTLRYPQTGATLTLAGAEYQEMESEEKGEDLYFIGEVEGIMASVLFYRLGQEEYWTNRLVATQYGLAADDARMALGSFVVRSQTKPFESQEKSWEEGELAYRDVNIESVEGTELHQKNMYAYTTFGDSLYVQVHFSKIDYSPADSVRMAAMLAGVAKAK